MTSYWSGDAKWYFTPLSLEPGIYTYSDSYTSNVSTEIGIQYHHTNGTFSYEELTQYPATSNFVTRSIGFVIPSGIADVTLYRVIRSIGTLAVDNVTLDKSNGSGGVFQNGAVTFTFD